MPDVQFMTLAAAWLRPEPDASWAWDDSGEAIVWSDGSTLTFRAELTEIVAHFIPDRLPPLGLIILLLASVRGKVTQIPSLNALSHLPSDLRTGLPAKLNLIDFLAEECTLLCPVEQAIAVLNLLKTDLPLRPLERKSSGPPQINIYLRILTPPLSRLTVDLLRNRLKTGLEAPPNAADISISWDSLQIQTLVGDILEDPELGGMAKLVRDFMATFTLPRAPVSPEFGALGGVADISNRGPIHRLLVSELAHDDDTLTLRLAMNEALFLKNAPPIAHPQTELVVLFDLGIRMWGIPRVLATAAALAFLSKTPKKQLSQAWLFCPGNNALASAPNTTRALSQPTPTTPPHLQPVDFTSKEGLLDLLSKLELNLHPGPALDLWENQGLIPGASEVVLLTHEESWEDSDFQDYLHQFLTNQSASGRAAPFYILTFLRDGNTQLRSVSVGGHLLLQSAKINLQPLLPKLSSPLRSKDADIPAFVRLFPPPFLLPTPTNLDSNFVISTPEGYSAGVTDKGSIWHWDSSKHGAIPALLRPLPGETVFFSFVETLASVLIVHLDSEENQIHVATWNRKKGAKEESYSIFVPIDLPSKPRHFFHRFGILYIIYSNMVDVVNLRTGKQLIRQSFPDHHRLDSDTFEWIGQGFFRQLLVNKGTSIACSLSWTGQALKFEPISLSGTSAEDVILMFHRAGFEGPWLIDNAGNLIQTCPPFQRMALDIPKNCLPEVSPDGRELWVPLKSNGGHVIPLGDDAKKSRYCISRVSWLLQIPSPFYTLRNRISQIIPESNGALTLISDKGRAIRLEYNPKKRVFCLTVTGARPIVSLTVRNFDHPIKPPEGSDYTLMAARWKEIGSQAILDSRGLLHLQPPDSTSPEITFILADSGSPLPIWASDGTKLGPSFFLGRDIAPQGDVEKIHDHICKFCAMVQ